MRSTKPIPGVLRLAASALAALGLLGHGLAMLLVSLLAAPAEAAPGRFPAFIEICGADGPSRLVPGQTGAPQERPNGPKREQADGCPVCTAFAQNAAAVLPAVAVLSGREIRATAPRRPGQRAARLPAAMHAHPRAPPAAA
jgi:hypothetical protein